MATKRTTKTKVKKKAVEVEPLEAKVVPAIEATPARAKKPAAKSKKKPLVKPAIPIDPFAEVATATSPVKKKTASKRKAVRKTAAAIVEKPVEAAEPAVKVSAAFEALADVSLPELARENRARLQMQSPTRLHLYWSLKENPWASLRNVFGESIGSYTLVVKLIDVTHGVEEIHECEPEGDRWFDVDANTEYRAEIGFYAPNRPSFRILYSNSILTPRRSPSTRPATDSQWRVSANKFAEVLDVAGFSRDAFDVALAGDDHPATDDVTRTAFFSMIKQDARIEAVPTEDIRYAMLSLASGVAIADLRGRVSKRLYEILIANTEQLTPESAIDSLTEHFDVEESDFSEETIGSAVFGASMINFPRTMRTRRTVPGRRYNPLSSHSFL